MSLFICLKVWDLHKPGPDATSISSIIIDWFSSAKCTQIFLNMTVLYLLE